MLVSKINGLIFQRSRATYHQQSNKWVPRFVRRFFLQYPKAPAYFILGIAVTAMFSGPLKNGYRFLTLSKEEYAVYAAHYDAVTRGRMKHGKDFYFPFFNENKAEMLPFKKKPDAE